MVARSCTRTAHYVRRCLTFGAVISICMQHTVPSISDRGPRAGWNRNTVIAVSTSPLNVDMTAKYACEVKSNRNAYSRRTRPYIQHCAHAPRVWHLCARARAHRQRSYTKPHGERRNEQAQPWQESEDAETDRPRYRVAGQVNAVLRHRVAQLPCDRARELSRRLCARALKHAPVC